MAIKTIGPIVSKGSQPDCSTGWCESSMPRPTDWGSPESAKSNPPKNPPKNK